MADLFNRGFFVREPAWHGKGTVIQDYPGMAEAMKLAGHDHQIVEEKLGILRPDSLLPLSGFKALTRTDTGEVVSVRPATYAVIQNTVPWEIIDKLFESGAKWDTAGMLDGKYDENSKEVRGQVYWCLALLDEPQTIKGDTSFTYPYLAATWSHDGTQALRFRAMSVRIVCANTHYSAMYGADGAELDVTIKHIGDVRERIAKAKQAISLARTAQAVYIEQANLLAAMPVSDAQIETFISTVIPLPDIAAPLITERVRNNVDKARDQLRSLFDSRTIPSAIRNTAYGLVEAGVEYFDHVRRALSSDTYFSRNVLRLEPAKARLVETAREIALAN